MSNGQVVAVRSSAAGAPGRSCGVRPPPSAAQRDDIEIDAIFTRQPIDRRDQWGALLTKLGQDRACEVFGRLLVRPDDLSVLRHHERTVGDKLAEMAAAMEKTFAGSWRETLAEVIPEIAPKDSQRQALGYREKVNTFKTNLAAAISGSIVFEWPVALVREAPVRDTEVDWRPVVQAVISCPGVDHASNALFHALESRFSGPARNQKTVDVRKRLLELMVVGLQSPQESIHISVANAFEASDLFHREADPHLRLLLSSRSPKVLLWGLRLADRRTDLKAVEVSRLVDLATTVRDVEVRRRAVVQIARFAPENLASLTHDPDPFVAAFAVARETGAIPDGFSEMPSQFGIRAFLEIGLAIGMIGSSVNAAYDIDRPATVATLTDWFHSGCSIRRQAARCGSEGLYGCWPNLFSAHLHACRSDGYDKLFPIPDGLDRKYREVALREILEDGRDRTAIKEAFVHLKKHSDSVDEMYSLVLKVARDPSMPFEARQTAQRMVIQRGNLTDRLASATRLGFGQVARLLGFVREG